MYTQYWGPINRDKIATDSSVLEQVARKLQQGQIVAFPTETIYGLGGSILHARAIQNMFLAKKRCRDKAFAIAVASLEQIKFIAVDISEECIRLLHEFFPGPLTLVMKKNPNLSSIITGGNETVAVRFSSDLILRILIKMTGCPLALTSANSSGKLGSTKVSHVREDLYGVIDGIVDGGETKHGMESTVLSLVNPSHPIILRSGVVSHCALEKALRRPVRIMHQNNALYVHKFRSVVRLFYSWEEMTVYLKLSYQGKRLIMSSEKSPFSSTYDSFILRATNLYDGLRLAERKRYSEILVHCSPEIRKNTLLLHYLKQIAST